MSRNTFLVLISLLITQMLKSATGPDIVVVRAEYDTNQIQYQQFLGTITLKNIGDTIVNQFNVTNIYFSKDSIYDDSDVRGGYISISELNANDSITGSIRGGANQFGINADSSYKYVIVRADYRGEVTETDENNNIWVGRVNITNARVDLAVKSYNYTGPDTVRHGDLLNFGITFENLGSENIYSIYYKYFLSADTVFDATDIGVGHSNWMGFDWTNVGSATDELAIPTLSQTADYYLFVQIDTVGQEIDVKDYNLLNNIKRLCKLYIKNDSINQVLNFDQEFGTRTWTEDGFTWSWDNSGWDNIRNYIPHTGSGHGMSSPGYSAKLSTTELFYIDGLWIQTDMASGFSYLNILGFDENDSLIYSKPLNPEDYEIDYEYETLGWEKVKSIQFDYDQIDEMFPVSLYYDDMNLTITVDPQPLTIGCPSDQTLCNTHILPDYSDLAVITGSSGDYTIVQTPKAGTILSELTRVTLKVTDEALNEDSCTFNVSSLVVFNSIEETAIDNYTSPSGKYTWETSGTYFDTLPNAVGCDSVLTINLTIVGGNTSSSIYENACNTYTSPSGKYTFVTSGIFYDTIPNAAGLDSIITIYLTIGQSTISSKNVTRCNGYTSPSGRYHWTESGTYNDTIFNTTSCYDIITVNLIITKVDTSITVSGNTLWCNNSDADYYQWYDCETGEYVIDGNGSYYVPSFDGTYAVYIKEGDCYVFSNCYTVDLPSALNPNFSSNTSIYPNPTEGEVTIDLGEVQSEFSLKVLNITGKVISRENYINTDKFSLEIKGGSGMYFIQLSFEDEKQEVIKVFKN